MTEARPLRVLVADDEPLARQKMRDLLGAHPDVEVVAECRDGHEAARMVEEHLPDLVFLDVQMPRMTGVEVVQAVGVERMPVTVFVTAFDQFAVQAFELNALDYLLKPFDARRLDAALDRARRALRAERPGYPEELASALRRLAAAEGLPSRFVVRTGGGYVFVRPEEIDWVESADNYVTLHCGGRRHLLRETLTAMESRLDPTRFVRIRASAVVNLDRVARVEPWSGTEFQFVLADGTRILSSRRYRDRLRALIP